MALTYGPSNYLWPTISSTSGTTTNNTFTITYTASGIFTFNDEIWQVAINDYIKTMKEWVRIRNKILKDIKEGSMICR